MTSLHNDVLQHIFSYLQEPKDLRAATETCKQWNQLCKKMKPETWPKVKMLVDTKNLVINFKRVSNTFDNNLNAHGARGRQIAKIKDAALGIETSGNPNAQLPATEAQQLLGPLLHQWSMDIEDLIREARELKINSSDLIERMKNCLEKVPNDHALKAAFDEVQKADNLLKIYLYINVRTFVLDPFNAAVEVCNILGIKGVPLGKNL